MRRAQLKRGFYDGVAKVSRRLERPELLAAVNAPTRQAQLDEVAGRAILAATLAGTGIYVDVGANRGQILREAVRVAPSARHVAFEPIPELAAELARALPGVDCRRKALGAEAGTAEFCHFTGRDGFSGLRRRPSISDQEGRPRYFDVEVSTLDAELAELTPRVLKIDVEGGELQALQGARELLARARPLVMFEHEPDVARLYGASSQQLWELLSEQGYTVFSLLGAGPYERDAFAAASGIVNWLAVPAGTAV